METYDQNPNRELNRINKQKKRRTAENESAKEIYCWLHMEFQMTARILILMNFEVHIIYHFIYSSFPNIQLYMHNLHFPYKNIPAWGSSEY